VPRQHVADAGNPAVWATDRGESLECEGGAAQYRRRCSRLWK
jgi:hypothetical protein